MDGSDLKNCLQYLLGRSVRASGLNLGGWNVIWEFIQIPKYFKKIRSDSELIDHLERIGNGSEMNPNLSKKSIRYYRIVSGSKWDFIRTIKF
jgi:hypothetical protein